MPVSGKLGILIFLREQHSFSPCCRLARQYARHIVFNLLNPHRNLMRSNLNIISKWIVLNMHNSTNCYWKHNAFYSNFHSQDLWIRITFFNSLNSDSIILQTIHQFMIKLQDYVIILTSNKTCTKKLSVFYLHFTI